MTSSRAGTNTGLHDALLVALLAPRAAGGPRAAVKELLRGRRRYLNELIAQLPAADRGIADELADSLAADSIWPLFCDDERFPETLRIDGAAPPALFCLGSPATLRSPAVGICGSRNASAEGLHAARVCGDEAARLGITVVSGYAKGVDTESHTAVLRSGGSTVAVLAEGISRFRYKRAYVDLRTDSMLVVSQFPPRQPWNAGAATERNRTIIGLSDALIVVEAASSSGTMRAGRAALEANRPVWALALASGTPPGNQELIDSGAMAVGSRAELVERLRDLDDPPGEQTAINLATAAAHGDDSTD